MVNHGLIPGGVSLKQTDMLVFFTVVNPMDDQDVFWETPCVLSKARIASCKKHWETFSGHSTLVQFEARSTRTENFNKQDHAVVLYDTLPAEFIDKAICMKTKDQLYQRESVILRPRVVLKANCKVVHKIYLYKKQHHLGNRNKMRRATEKPEAIRVPSCRMHGDKIMSLSWSRCSEKKQHKKQFLKDMSQKQEIKSFSEESQQSLGDMNQTRIFELCENSATSMSWLQFLFRNRDQLLQLREKFEVQAESYNNPDGSWRLHFNLALSSRRILLEDQSTANLSDTSRSSR